MRGRVTDMCLLGKNRADGTWYTKTAHSRLKYTVRHPPPFIPILPPPPTRQPPNLLQNAGDAPQTKLAALAMTEHPMPPGAVLPCPMRLAMHLDVHTWRAIRPALSPVHPLHYSPGLGASAFLGSRCRKMPACRKMGLAAASEAVYWVLNCFVVHSAPQAELRQAPQNACSTLARRAL